MEVANFESSHVSHSSEIKHDYFFSFFLFKVQHRGGTRLSGTVWLQLSPQREGSLQIQKCVSD